ncbi:MAG: hypothetical protein ACFFCO_11050, partial [Promethearchaeota archaeon]
MSEFMMISPHYNVEHWRALDFSTEDDWQKAIEIFEDRVRGRFLDIISLFEHCTYGGFAVLALDCLLIETLQQFREGLSETPRRKSENFYVSFLTETSFGSFFTTEMARMFYDQIRCGILHQAEVKGSSRVLIREGEPLVRITDNGKGLIINRKLFHEQLVKEFEDYVTQLPKDDPANMTLREKFKRKMEC